MNIKIPRNVDDVAAALGILLIVLLAAWTFSGPGDMITALPLLTKAS